MANMFYYCGKLSFKLLIFKLIIIYFGQNAPDCTIFIMFFSGQHARTRLAQIVNQHSRANYASGM